MGVLVKKYGSKNKAAREMGISHSMFGQVMNRVAKPGHKTLRFLGLEELRVYVPSEPPTGACFIEDESSVPVGFTNKDGATE